VYMKRQLIGVVLGATIVIAVNQVLADSGCFTACYSDSVDWNDSSVQCTGTGECSYSVDTPDCTECVNYSSLGTRTGKTCCQDEQYTTSRVVWDGGTCSGGTGGDMLRRSA
jgi:hypothetical protein